MSDRTAASRSHRPRLSAFVPGLAAVALLVIAGPPLAAAPGSAGAPPAFTPAWAPTWTPAAVQEADTTAPRPINVADFDRWRSVSEVELSADGRWVTFAYSGRDEDQTLVVRNLDTGDEHELERATSPTFSEDGRWLAFFIALPRDEAKKLEERRQPVTRKAGLLELATGDRWEWDDAQSLAFAESSSHLLVHKRKADREAEHDGTPLILRNLADRYEEVLGYVHERAFSDAGRHLAWTVSAPDGDGNGLYLMDLSTGARRALDNGGESYRRLTWHDETPEGEGGRALAVLRSREIEDKVERENELLAFPDPAAAPERAVRIEVDSAGALPPETLPEGVVISERRDLTWSRDGERLFFGFKAQRDDPPEEENGEERADVDVWHWADDRIQSVQQVQANRDRNRTHLAVLHVADGRVVALTDDDLPTERIAPDGRWVVAEDPHPYTSDWLPSYSDHYRIDVATGERHMFLEGHLRSMGFSPDGARFLYWKDEDVWAYEPASDTHRNLTAATREANPGLTFVNEEFDRWGEKPPHGIAGWGADDAGVILETRFDLWLVPSGGGAGRSLTGQEGEAREIRLRYLQLDPDEEWVELDAPLLLSAFGERDKRAGFYRLDGDRLQELVMDDAWFGRPRKAAEADRLLLTRETFREFPDLWTADGLALADLERITDANPHQDEYRWGRRILFDYVTVRGDTLQGTLAIPDDFTEADLAAGERRPMLVNYYEKNSQNLNRHPTPSHASRPQFARFVSHGYLVMQPDVAFHFGDTHSQMKDAVLAATEKVIEMGYADPDAIGLHGHSFSGQGSAYIATQTDRFAAILAGAAATNLVSDFNQLWKTAGTNQHRYDTYGQGRFATNPYDDFDLYVSQSGVQNAPGMNTPLLLLHGTDDGSVEWLQAVEFYNALRFLDKPVILLSYPGEAHSLRRHENREDFQIRMHHFFDHHLKGADAPEWMTAGVPFLEKPYHSVSEEGTAVDAETVTDDSDQGGGRGEGGASETGEGGAASAGSGGAGTASSGAGAATSGVGAAVGSGGR